MNGQMAELLVMKARLRAKAGKGVAAGKSQREPVTSIAKVKSDRSRKNSRAKGNRGELDVAEAFSRWCGEHVRRTPRSGGWGTVEFGVTADLVCSKKAWPFHAEVKHREGWMLDDLVTGVRRSGDKSIVAWWRQCLDSCPQSASGFAKEPLLVFRRNRQPWLVMVRESFTRIDAASFPLDNEQLGPHNVIVLLLSEFLANMPVPKGLRGRR